MLIILNLGGIVLSIIILARHLSYKEGLERTERVIKEEIAKNREELSNSLKSFLDTFLQQLSLLSKTNEEKLDQIRNIVDEKLHSTLEKRLGDSFRLVTERLELVHKGLGEMQTLASGVGDLKKVLSNVKTKGIMGEIQLENLLEQIFTPEQYAKNVATKKDAQERVEFAIKYPSPDEKDKFIWLPIDAKFPLENYQKLISAQEQANQTLIEESVKALENRIRSDAKNIKEKYLDPPNTTEFAILFLPMEGLYAEVLRRTGLWESLQREYKVIITGPNTLYAYLSSLQMAFRAIAIGRRSTEVWTVLGAIKTEFAKFGEILEKTRRKLEEATTTIEDASRKSRTIERKLRDVQELPSTTEEVNLFASDNR